MSAWDPDKIALTIARDLREIKKLYGMLGAQAYFAATGHDAGDLDPINLLGPVADIATWQRRYDFAEAAFFKRAENGEEAHWKGDYAGDQVAELHPLLVLATWEDCVRDELGVPSEKLATVDDAADYLGSAVPWMLDVDENGDINFLAVDALANDLAKCRTMLENVLKAGRRADTGAPCIECGKPLVKVWREAEEYDQWECRYRSCEDYEEPVGPERYKNAVHAGYLAHATKLTATDMLEAYRIRPGTLIVWAHREKVAKRGKDESGRILYDVEQALAQRDKTSKDEDDAA